MSNLNNAVSIIENDPALRGIVWYDEFLQRLMTGDPAREWTEADDINLALYMQRTLGLTKMSKDLASQAVVATAFSHPRNCVKEWLESLPAWDGIERCNAFFVDVFGAEESAYSTAVGGNFWKSLVARATQPGCKVDNMVVLEGPQGLRKSTALALIVGERWFAEAREEITQKDFYVSLQGKLLVEIAELDAFSRADVTKIKQVVTCRVDRFRPPYGRTAIDHARQGVFVATTNKTDWNRDDTGARRFWPIRCNGDVRLDLVAENRVQYYAEALARLKAGETWWEMPQAETKREQDARYDADPWLDRIRNIVMGESSVTTMQIMDKLGLDVSKQDRGTQMRVGSCMRILGWERKQARDGLKRAYLYMKGDDGDDGGDKKLF